MTMKNYNRADKKMETVTAFHVSLRWQSGYTTVEQVTSVDVTTVGQGTSSEAITRAIEMVKPLRVDAPQSVNASMTTFEREITELIGDGTSITVVTESDSF
jgi:hypothetical protein